MFCLTDRDFERLLSLPLARILRSKRFIVLVKLFEALLLELLALPDGFETGWRNGDTFELVALRSLEDSVSESYTDDRFVVGFLVTCWLGLFMYP